MMRLKAITSAVALTVMIVAASACGSESASKTCSDGRAHDFCDDFDHGESPIAEWGSGGFSEQATYAYATSPVVSSPQSLAFTHPAGKGVNAAQANLLKIFDGPARGLDCTFQVFVEAASSGVRDRFLSFSADDSVTTTTSTANSTTSTSTGTAGVTTWLFVGDTSTSLGVFATGAPITPAVAGPALPKNRWFSLGARTDYQAKSLDLTVDGQPLSRATWTTAFAMTEQTLSIGFQGAESWDKETTAARILVDNVVCDVSR